MTLTRGAVTTRLALGILGPLVASLDGEPVSLGGQRQRSVLVALLLARGRVLSTDRLTEAVWAGGAPPSANASLHAYVSHLRRRLEPDRPARSPATVLVSHGNGYALRVPTEAVDAWRFEDLVRTSSALGDPLARVAALDAALGLWRGEAIAEYADQDWARPDAHRLTELHGLAREQLLAARLDAGESSILVPEIESLLAEAPLREERWRLLALALYRSHRQADALATLRRARTMLGEELGVDPGPALRSLEAEVLAQSERLDAPVPAAALPATAVSVTAVSLTGPHQAPGDELVDRETEMGHLRETVRGVRAGRSGLVVISGPAGIGKTRLLDEVKAAASAAGALVLSARGSQLEKEFGFGAVRQLFEPALARSDRDDLLDGAAAAARGVFDATQTPDHRAEGVFGVLHGLYWLAVNASARQPLLLAVDDLQWCDTGSLRFLAYLVRRVEGLAVTVVATVRTGEEYADGLVAELTGEPTAQSVRPGPLSPAGVGDLVRARLGEGADLHFINACHHTTGGNPLLLLQLLRALATDRVPPDAAHADIVRAIGSRAVSSMVLLRFSRLPEHSREVARSVAVLGDGASLPVVAALTGLSDDETAVAVAALARAELLRDTSPLGFVHPLVEGAVYGDIPLGERELAHERAAGVLSSFGASPEQVAAQLLLVPARADAGVVRTLQEAAARDALRGSAESAARYLRRAVLEPPPAADLPEILLELGTLEAMTDGHAAVTDLTAACSGLREPRLRARASVILSRTLIFAGERGAASICARSAIDRLPDDLADERQALLAMERIGGYMHDLPPEKYAASVRPEVHGRGTGARALSATLAWEDVISGEHRDRALQLARFAVADDRLRAVDAGLSWVVAGIVMELCGEDTVGYWNECLHDSYQRGALFGVLGSHLWLGFAQWRRGELREAMQSMANCREQHQLWGETTLGQPYVDGFAVRILLDRGDLAGARRQLDEARTRNRFGEGVRLFGEAEAAVLLTEGRPDAALDALESVENEMAIVANPAWRPWRSDRAVVLSALGRHDEARSLVETELELARRWGLPDLVGRTTRILGELGPPGQDPHGPDPEQVDLLREAVSLLAEGTHRLEHARALTALAEALIRRGQDGPEARAALTMALPIADRCAAYGLRARVAARLGELGVRVSPEPSARSTLTTTERHIAAQAVHGVPVQAIAESLFLTPHMVRQSITSVSERLGVTDFAGLEAALAEL